MIAAIVLAAACSVAAASQETHADFYLKNGQTIVFFGDSITEAGTYVDYVDVFLLTRFPDRPFRILNRGISSETRLEHRQQLHERNRLLARLRAWRYNPAS